MGQSDRTSCWVRHGIEQGIVDLADDRNVAHGDVFDLAEPAAQLAFDEPAGSAQIPKPDLVDVDAVDGGQGVDHSEAHMSVCRWGQGSRGMRAQSAGSLIANPGQ